jgi:quinol monooxygenase YgiN
MIHIVAILTAARGQREALLAEFKSNSTTVRLERGCIQYDPAIDIEGGPETLTRIGPDGFTVIEQWESRDAAEAHAASTHMAAYTGRVKKLVLSRVIYALCSI